MGQGLEGPYFSLGNSQLLKDTEEGRHMVFSCASTFENLNLKLK